MGYRSTVTIMCEANAFSMIIRICKEFNFQPHHLYQIKQNGKWCYIMQWEDVKWYADYKPVSEIEDIINVLDKKENKLNYGYHMVLIGEDGLIEDKYNDDGCYFEDFYPETKMVLPDNIEEVREDKRKEAIL